MSMEHFPENIGNQVPPEATTITISSHCGNGSCVGFEQSPGGRKRIVDLKGGVENGVANDGIQFSVSALRCFVSGVKAGEFDVPPNMSTM